MLNGTWYNLNWGEMTAGLRVSDPLREIAEGIRRDARRLAPLPPCGDDLTAAVRVRDPMAEANEAIASLAATVAPDITLMDEKALTVDDVARAFKVPNKGPFEV